MTAALVLASLLSSPASAGPACDALARHGRLHRAARRAERPWAELKSAFLEHLVAQPRNPAAARAAAFLRRSALGLAEAPVAQSVDAAAGAEYDAQAKLIVLDQADLAPLWEAWPTPRRAAVLRETVARLSPVLVHELAHARLGEELGPLPRFSEEELLADAEETLYLWGRLEADPDHLGLGAFDALVEPQTPARRRGWWKRPASSDERAIEDAEDRSPDRWVPERWRLVRGMGGGYEAFAETLRQGGVLEGQSLFSLGDDERERALADTRRLRAAHERCLSSAAAEDRADIQGWVDRLEGEELAYEDPARLRRASGRFRQVMDGQRRDLETLRGR